jgi:hypothetical protein
MIVLISILIAAICIGIMYAKMILIWRDSQLDKFEKIKKDLEKIKNAS